MVHTRSKSAPQTKASPKEEEKEHVKEQASIESSLAKEPRKRKAEQADAAPSKKQKPSSETNQADAVIINRAPVLHLWAACVAHFVHPELSLQTCLSAGLAVSIITAVAKGRSIGTIEPPDPEKKKEKDQKKAEQADDDFDEVQVMQFKLRIKDALALVGSTDKKGKPGSDGNLKSKFGEEQYERVRETFDECLKSWKGSEDSLNEQAFSFYEDFRPSIKAGQAGWGRKGELNLDNVRSSVVKEG